MLNIKVTTLVALGLLTAASAQAASDREIFLQNIERITHQDAELKSVQETQKAEHSDISALQSTWLPDLQAKVNRVWKENTTEGLSSEQHRSNLSLESTVNLYAFGRDRSNWQLGEKREESLDLFLRSAELDAEKRAAFDLLDYAESQRQLKLADQIEGNRQRIVDLALSRFNRGLLPEIDYKKTRIDLELAQVKKLEKATAFETKKTLIEKKLGALPEKVGLVLDTSSDSLDSFLKHVNQGQSPGNLQLRLAESLVHEKELQKDLSFKKYLPSLDVTGARFIGLGGADKSVSETVFTLSLSVPLYDRGLTRAEHQLRQHAALAATADRDNIKQSSELRAGELLRQLRLLGNSLSLKREILRKAQSIRENSLKRFEQATISVNDLTLDEDRLLLVEDEYNATLFQMNRSAIEFCQVKGLTLKACLGN